MKLASFWQNCTPSYQSTHAAQTLTYRWSDKIGFVLAKTHLHVHFDPSRRTANRASAKPLQLAVDLVCSFTHNYLRPHLAGS